jgi:hypothetical protein
MVSFLGATAHFIVRRETDQQLILRSGLLAFRHLLGPHTGEHLAEILYGIIKVAGIEQRVLDFYICLILSEPVMH